MIRHLLLNIFMYLVGRLSGTGLGRFGLVSILYQKIRKVVMNKGEVKVCIHGIDMFVHGNKAYGDEMIFSSGYEMVQTQLFNNIIKEGMVVVDIGANVGYYTLLASQRVSKSGLVYAFEPEPQNYNLLIKNIKYNNLINVYPLQKAVCDDQGEGKLFLSEKGAGEHSLYGSSDEESIIVDTISLDNYFEGCVHVDVDVIKIDAEGAEMAILLGMEEVAKRNDNLSLFVEFYPDGFGRSGHSPHEFWDKLYDYGFNYIYLINEKKHEVDLVDFVSALMFCKDSYATLICSKVPILDGDND